MAVATSHDQDATSDLLMSQLRPRLQDYERHLAELTTYQEDLMNQGGVAVDHTLGQLQSGLLLVCACSLLTAGGLAWLVTRSVTAPLLDVIGAVDRVSRGDLTVAVRTDRADELGDLQQALLRLKDALSSAVGVVRHQAEGVAGASSEIAQGNLDLSQRTEEQASALQQTAASMEEVGTTVTHNAENARQASELALTKRRQLRLAEELHDAAIRNLKVEERERQRLAGELHDEFGQNLAALQTHLKLSAPDLAAVGRGGVVDRLLELTRMMQQNIGRVLDSLRPAALDELGLYGAIDRGSLRRLAEDAGLVFETRLEGDARLLASLNPVHRVAAFRVAQEAITNVVRHARATHCSLRLRVSARGGQLCLFLDIRDDGRGRVAEIRPGNGVTGLQDRVLALGGRLVISQLSPGLRVHALLRQPLL